MANRSLACLALLMPLGACASAPPPVRSTVVPAQEMRAGDPQLDDFYVDFSAGKLNYTDKRFGPADDLFAGGISAVWSRRGRIGYEVGAIFGAADKSFDDDGEEFSQESSLVELYLGPRYNIQTGSRQAQPFVGAGLSFQQVDIENPIESTGEDPDTEGSGLGGYVHAGVRWSLSDDASLGFDWRYLTGLGDSFVFDEMSLQPNYHLFAFFIGLKF